MVGVFVSVRPAYEAALFGWLSAVSFPLGVAMVSQVTEPQKYRRHVAWLLAFASGAVVASLHMEVFGAAVNTYLLRAMQEEKIEHDHPNAEAEGKPVAVIAAESGGHTLLDDETAHCAKVCVYLCCGLAPVGAIGFVAIHRWLIARCSWAKTEDERLAITIILGQVVDGVPEAALIGLFAVRHELSLVLLLSFALANLPEAISVTLLRAFPMQTVWMVWTGLFLATGVLSCLTAVLMLTLSPTLQGHVMDDYTFAAFEGLASGAMLVVVAGQYLPDAARQLGGEGEPLRAGVALVLGIVAAVLVKTIGGTVSIGASHAEGTIDFPNLTLKTEELQAWGVGGEVMPSALLALT